MRFSCRQIIFSFSLLDHDGVLMTFNPITTKVSCVGDSFTQGWKYFNDAAAFKDIIYGAPYDANQVLQIDFRPIGTKYKSIIGGINSFPKYDPDRLGVS